MARLQKRHLGTTASQKAFRSVSHSASQDSTQPLMRSFGTLLMCALLAISTVLAPVSMAVQSAWADDNALVIAIDPGHGGEDDGASGNGVIEKNANWAIAMACVNELNTYSGVKVVVTRSQNETVKGLDTRVQRAVKQGADVVISIHCNSVVGAPSANGVETFVPNDTNYLYEQTRVPGYGLGSAIQKKLVSLGFYDRTVKVRNSASGTMYKDASGKDVGIADYYGIIYNSRINGIPGIIVEHGFVSNASDAAKLKDSTWLTKIGVADATAIAEYYGLSKVPQNGSAMPDANVTKTGTAVVTEQVYETDSPIMGETELGVSSDAAGRKAEAVEKMAAWYKSKTGSSELPTYEKTKAEGSPNTYASYGASNLSEFCGIVYDEAVAEGVRPEVVFAQMMLETGWLKFGGDVNWWQCNFCGLGATGNKNPGVDFGVATDKEGNVTADPNPNGVRIGVRAQVQHLKGYASTEALKNECVDPRFKYLAEKRGIAPTVQGLSGTWATDTSYGDSLVKLVNGLLGVDKTALTQVGVDMGGTALAEAKNTQATVYVDGKETTLTIDSNGKATLPISGSGPQSIVMYEYKETGDPHTSYPTGMSTWLVSVDSKGDYVTTRYYGLDDLLIYSGCAIRVTGKQGIRMVTGISSNVKTALTSSAGIGGYTLVETGTLIAWSSDLKEGSDLTFSTPSVKKGTAYQQGKANPVYATKDGIEYYTNVLVGFNSKNHYVNDLAMRPYATLKDANGNQFTIYGGTIYRSIEYIAGQYAGRYAEGTSTYAFVQGILNTCK